MEESSLPRCIIFERRTKVPIPLTSIKVSINVRGYLVDVDSTLCFKNKGTDPIEALFSFPVDENGAVYKFEIQIDGKTVTAECQEKQEANKIYEESVDFGYTATYLGENDATSDAFTCKLGNLQPGKNASVRFAYISELKIAEDGSLDFVLPTLLNPRYNPSPDEGGSQEATRVRRSSLTRLLRSLFHWRDPNEPVLLKKNIYIKGCDQPYEFKIDISIEGIGKIVNITSAKDKLDVSYKCKNTKAHVKLSNKFIADHDFGFNIKLEDAHKPRILIEKGKATAEGLLKNDVIMLNFFPAFEGSRLSNKHEFIFLIDRSQSMDGFRIEDARASLLLFLKSLPIGCYFNIIGFGSRFKVLFEEGSALYSEENLKKALAYQECIEADMGGTEILNLLKYVYKLPLIPTHSRQVLLITDGEVYNTSAIIKLVQSNSHDTKVFTLGIGEGASTSLVEGVARAGRGKAEFVKTDETMQPVVMRLLKYAMQASVTNVTIEWKLGRSVKLTQIPQHPPPIFDGDRLIIYAFINEPSVLGGIVELKGEIGDEKFVFPVEVNVNRDVLDCAKEDSMLVHRMAAKLQIKHLQDSDDVTKSTNKEVIVALSLASNVVSSYTAMVGIVKHNKKKRIKAKHFMITCPIPNVVDPTLSFPDARNSFDYPLTVYSFNPEDDWPVPKFDKMKKICYERRFDSFITPSVLDINLGDLENSVDPIDVVLEIISFVEFRGQWKFNEKLIHLLSLKEVDVKNSSVIKDLDVWTTAIVLSYFESKCADNKEKWEMVRMKSIQWMEQQDLEGHSTDDLLKQASEILLNI